VQGHTPCRGSQPSATPLTELIPVSPKLLVGNKKEGGESKEEGTVHRGERTGKEHRPKKKQSLQTSFFEEEPPLNGVLTL